MRTVRIAALGAGLLAGAGATWPAPTAATTLFLVRHGQKGAGRDPALTPAGEAWAKQLASLLAPVPLTAVYVTDTRRSAATGAPAARAKGLTPLVRTVTDGPAHVRTLAAELRDRPDTDAVLAVEHSDTVPALLVALGATGVPTLGDSDYGDVFIATWSAGAPHPTVTRLALPPGPAPAP